MKKSPKGQMTFSIGCEKYGTSVMKEMECLLFVETALENNGGNVEDALSDMRMVDTLLYAERLHKIAGHNIKKTASGHYRKGSDIYTTFERILEGRISGNI